tara:strand:- start:961 stop:1719 length:759 start_codon:yes stop_codon:yes gene_type:complete
MSNRPEQQTAHLNAMLPIAMSLKTPGFLHRDTMHLTGNAALIRDKLLRQLTDSARHCLPIRAREISAIPLIAAAAKHCVTTFEVYASEASLTLRRSERGNKIRNINEAMTFKDVTFSPSLFDRPFKTGLGYEIDFVSTARRVLISLDSLTNDTGINHLEMVKQAILTMPMTPKNVGYPNDVFCHDRLILVSLDSPAYWFLSGDCISSSITAESDEGHAALLIALQRSGLYHTCYYINGRQLKNVPVNARRSA